jgi:hypothetical protein
MPLNRRRRLSTEPSPIGGRSSAHAAPWNKNVKELWRRYNVPPSLPLSRAQAAI